MGWVSILHRVTGVLLFLVLPICLYLLQHSLSGRDGYAEASAILDHPLAHALTLLAVVSLAHHTFAGLRHLALDLHCGVEKNLARLSARLVLVLSLLAALVAGWRLFL